MGRSRFSEEYEDVEVRGLGTTTDGLFELLSAVATRPAVWVVGYLLSTVSLGNCFRADKEVAKRVGCSEAVLKDALKMMTRANLARRTKLSGVYMLNPNLFWKGSPVRRAVNRSLWEDERMCIRGNYEIQNPIDRWERSWGGKHKRVVEEVSSDTCSTEEVGDSKEDGC